MSVTPSQTVGPYFSIGLPWPDGPDVVPDGDVVIRGVVLDGEREPIPDALVETWQADPSGALRGRGLPRLRALPDERGRARTRSGPSSRARSAARRRTSPCSVFARGLLDRVVTRIYFPEDDRREREPTRC